MHDELCMQTLPPVNRGLPPACGSCQRCEWYLVHELKGHMQGSRARDSAAEGLVPAAVLQGRVRVSEGGAAAAAGGEGHQHVPAR